MEHKSNYRIKIVTDGLKAENTFVYMDGVRLCYLQEFELEATSSSIIVPVQMTFLPLPIDEVVFEDSDIEAEEKIAKFKNKIEIYTDGHSTNTMIYLNKTIIGFLQSFRLYASANQEDIALELTQLDKDTLEVKELTIKDCISYKE